MESSQEEIINRILKDAKDEAGLIVKKAKESAELLLKKQRQNACADAEKVVHSILDRAQKEAEIIRGKTATDIKRQGGWAVLSEKNRLIQDVMEESKKRLETIEKTAKYVQLLEKLIVDSGSVLGGGSLTVLLNEKDLELNLNFAKLEKDIMTQTGVKTKLCLSEERIATTGVVVKTVDNKIIVDNTFEAILKRHENELKPKIAKILFN